MRKYFPSSIKNIILRQKSSARAIEILGLKYRAELPTKLESMERLVPKAAAGSRAALEEIVLHAHKLRGTARLFDLSALSDAMSDVEESLESLSSDHSDFRDSAAWLRVDKALYLAKSSLPKDDDSGTDDRGTEDG